MHYGRAKTAAPVKCAAGELGMTTQRLVNLKIVWSAYQQLYLPEEQRCSERLRLAGCRGVHNGDGLHIALYEGILALFKIDQAILLKEGLAAQVC